MEEENKRYWDKIKKPPTSSLKKIGGGRMSGKSAIDPQWRIMAMTEVFGPVGIGWCYKVVEHWTETANNEISSHVAIEFFIKDNGAWSMPIPGLGGSMLLASEKKGPFHSDEAFKMALTDALSVSMKALGMASDIYMGKFDGTKYNDRPDQLNDPKPMTEEQADTLLGFIDRLKDTHREASDYIGSVMSQNITDVRAQSLINSTKERMKW